MELNPDNRTEMIKTRVSEEEKILIKAKAEYYGYKQLKDKILTNSKKTNIMLL